MGKIMLTDNFQGRYCQIQATEEFKELGVKKGDLGGYVDSSLMDCEEGNMVSWVDKDSLFEGLVLFNKNIIEKSTIKAHSLKNNTIKNSRIDGFNCIENCIIENLVVRTSPFFSIRDGKILSNDDLKIMEIDQDRLCAIYPHVVTSEKYVFLGDIDNYLFVSKEKMINAINDRRLKSHYALTDEELDRISKFVLED